MIKVEFFRTREDGIDLYRTYSDENYLIEQVSTGAIYEEAVEEEPQEYIETDEKIFIEKEGMYEESEENQ